MNSIIFVDRLWVPFEKFVRGLVMSLCVLAAACCLLFPSTATVPWLVASGSFLCIGLAAYASGNNDDRAQLHRILVILIVAALYGRMSYGNWGIESCGTVSYSIQMPTASANGSTVNGNCTLICGNITSSLEGNFTTSIRSTTCYKITLNPLRSNPEDGLGLAMHHGGIETKFMLDPAHFFKAAIAIANQKAERVGAYFKGAGEFLKGFYHKTPWQSIIIDQMHSLQGWTEIVEGEEKEALGALHGDKDPPSQSRDNGWGENTLQGKESQEKEGL